MAKKEVKKKAGFTSPQLLILLTVMIASFLGRLDGTIVNLALPKIISDFGITVTQASWISTGYIIANAVFVPIFGKLGDMIGRKPLYLVGILGFVATSALAGLSFNLPSLVFFRILQAIFVSIDYPIALSIIAYSFEDRSQRAQAMGLWSAVFAVSAVLGPLIGGPLIDNFSWRSVFYINITLSLIGTYMAISYIHEPARKIRGIKNFDIWGSLLLGLGLGTMVFVLDQGQTWGWTSLNSIVSYIITAASLIGFLLIEQRQKEPVVDLKFFKIPTFTAAIITSFISFVGLIGGIFLIPIFVQNILGYNVTESGYLFIPMAVSLMIASPLSAKLSSKFQPRFLTSGGMFVAAGALYFLFAQIDIKWTFWDISLRLMLFAAGLAFSFAPLTTAATNTVDIHEVGVASSVLALARNIAGAFGVAIFATILANGTTSALLSIQMHSTVNSINPAVLGKVAALMITQANVLAFSNVFRISGVIMAIGAVSALFVKEQKRDFAEGKKVEQPMVEM